MKTKTCLLCEENIKHGSSQVKAVLWHFRPFEIRRHWGWFSGTFRMGGLNSVLCLASPLYNTLRRWKYRRYKLTSQFCALDDIPEHESLDKAHKEGWEAGDQAYPREKNPYTAGTAQREWWDAGWSRSMDELCNR